MLLPALLQVIQQAIKRETDITSIRRRTPA
jgi:hypothetical protein